MGVLVYQQGGLVLLARSSHESGCVLLDKECSSLGILDPEG